MIDKIQVDLPVELSHTQRVELVREYVSEITHGRCAYVAAIHDRGEDAHNPHAHIAIRDRDMETGDKVMKAGENRAGITPHLRETWDRVANEHLERAGRDERIDMRSNEAQGIGRAPGEHMGPHVAAMAEKGIQTERFDAASATQEYNLTATELEATRAELAAERAERALADAEAAAQARPARAEKEAPTMEITALESQEKSAAPLYDAPNYETPNYEMPSYETSAEQRPDGDERLRDRDERDAAQRDRDVRDAREREVAPSESDAERNAAAAAQSDAAREELVARSDAEYAAFVDRANAERDGEAQNQRATDAAAREADIAALSAGSPEFLGAVDAPQQGTEMAPGQAEAFDTDIGYDERGFISSDAGGNTAFIEAMSPDDSIGQASLEFAREEVARTQQRAAEYAERASANPNDASARWEAEYMAQGAALAQARFEERETAAREIAQTHLDRADAINARAGEAVPAAEEMRERAQAQLDRLDERRNEPAQIPPAEREANTEQTANRGQLTLQERIDAIAAREKTEPDREPQGERRDEREPQSQGSDDHDADREQLTLQERIDAIAARGEAEPQRERAVERDRDRELEM